MPILIMNETLPAKNSEKPKTIESLLNGDTFRLQVAKVLPKHLSAERFCRVALTALRKTPKLAQCDQGSFLQCLLSLSQYGLEPDGRRAHLIPYGTTCTLIIDYKGLVELVMRSGLVSYIHADVVCSADVFTCDRGEIKEHKVDYQRPRGSVYAAYALVRFKDGSEKAEVMSIEEIDSIRKRSKAGQSGPWITDPNEMAKKTAFRRLSKWLALSAEIQDAIDDDDYEKKTPEIAKPIFDSPTPEPEMKEAKVEPESTGDLQSKLASTVTSAGYAFDDFMRLGQFLGWFGDTQWPSFSDVPGSVCVVAMKSEKALLEAIKRSKEQP